MPIRTNPTVPAIDPLLSALPTAPETAAFRTVQWVWQSDPVLSAVVRTWAFLEGRAPTLDDAHGEDLNFDLPDATDPAAFPFVRGYLAGGRYAWGGQRQVEMDLQVNTLVVVAGTHQDDLTNLVGAMRTALRPADPDRYLAIDQAFRSIGSGWGSILDSGAPTQLSTPTRLRNLLAATRTWNVHLKAHY